MIIREFIIWSFIAFFFFHLTMLLISWNQGSCISGSFSILIVKSYFSGHFRVQWFYFIFLNSIFNLNSFRLDKYKFLIDMLHDFTVLLRVKSTLVRTSRPAARMYTGWQHVVAGYRVLSRCWFLIKFAVIVQPVLLSVLCSSSSSVAWCKGFWMPGRRMIKFSMSCFSCSLFKNYMSYCVAALCLAVGSRSLLSLELRVGPEEETWVIWLELPTLWFRTWRKDMSSLRLVISLKVCVRVCCIIRHSAVIWH